VTNNHFKRVDFQSFQDADCQETLMDQAQYDSIGTNYNRTRAADSRISAGICELLNLPSGSLIADIGAGTGNYSQALSRSGYRTIALEPSEEMRRQAVPNKNITWVPGFAESIPLADNSVDGAIVILALHHFKDAQKAVLELKRICPTGPVVVLTMDPREGEPFWFHSYFPEIHRQVKTVFRPINEVIDLAVTNSGWSVTVKKFPLPGNLIDRNMHSGWNKPEIYLDEQMRRNTSGFALASPDSVQRGLKQLQKDLSTGEWDRQYGFLRKLDSYDTGFRFIRFKK
jgi:ubiquinone/menaquinone biosynthesis C-methylase UbiE